jgi:hypothetical protein
MNAESAGQHAFIGWRHTCVNGITRTITADRKEQ